MQQLHRLKVAQENIESLRELCNVSAIGIEESNEDKCAVFPASSKGRQKCERCWHWETDIGQNAEHPTICGRCVEAVKQFKT